MGPPPIEDAVVLHRLTVADRRAVACRDVSLRVAAGTVTVLLGRSAGAASSVLSCVAGRVKPSAGRVLVFGEDAWRQRRRLRPLIARVAPDARTGPEEIWSRAAASPPRILLLDAAAGSRPLAQPLPGRIREAAAGGAAVLVASIAAADAEAVADRVGIFRSGALVLHDDVSALAARFRRLRYRNEITPTRTEYGTELDLFDAVRVRVRGWGVEAVVANFSEQLFERLRSTDGVVDAEAAAMTIGEIFDAVSPAEIETG